MRGFLVFDMRRWVLDGRTGGWLDNTLSLGSECRYAFAKNCLLNIQDCICDPATRRTPRLQDSRLNDWDEIGAFLRQSTRHIKHWLVTIIVARHGLPLKQTINMEPHLKPTNQPT